ncbi:MAG: uroporphyrinogen decarboxylase family protein [Verrucomicrobiota bacterium]|nr:uroporphyrinogen decarboxylase family protein [Verrucomicrobiota bacterium]
MNNRERVKAILHYEAFDRMPVVHFGYWFETLEKWGREGHLTDDEAKTGYEGCFSINQKLGFDFNWFSTFFYHGSLYPLFGREVLEELPDGSKKVMNSYGVVEMEKPGAGSIPMEVSHTLVDRASWEEHYLPRLQFSEERISTSWVMNPDDGSCKEFGDGGLDILKNDDRSQHYGLYCGSLIGDIRNWLGVVNLSYLQVDDEELLVEMIQTVADLDYRNTEAILKTGARFDFAHFWEDICFKNGPLVSPAFFGEMVAPHYRRITDLVRSHGIDIVSVDCDGWIDSLVPIWLENGVNTMFPIEVGTWDASIAPWREQYGNELRGVGGMNKTVFAKDRAAIDQEVERLKPLVELGGYIPCPDHRLPPDAEWDNVRYYCDQVRDAFGKIIG